MTAIVSITDVFPDAVQIQARDLQVGDKVFDGFGGTYALTSVKRLKGGLISTQREDGWRDRFEPAELITILRDEVLGSWNTGGDPASGCDKIAEIDGLCAEHDHAYNELAALGEGE